MRLSFEPESDQASGVIDQFTENTRNTEKKKQNVK